MAMGMMGPAVATQIFYRMRGGPAQDLSVDLRKAVAHINPLFLFKPTAGGYPLHSPLLTPSNAMAFSIYPTRDDRWYLPTAVYPRMWMDWAGLLGSGLDARSVSHAISQWNALDLENAAAERGMIGAMCRTPEEWYAHPQGEILAQTPLIEIVQIGDSDPELPPLTNADRPLSGIKVASFTHVIAGPVTSRTLAEQGAQVLDLASPFLEVGLLVQDACRIPLDIHGSEAEAILQQGRRPPAQRGRGGGELPRAQARRIRFVRRDGRRTSPRHHLRIASRVRLGWPVGGLRRI
jgi:CoA-transferase family III